MKTALYLASGLVLLFSVGCGNAPTDPPFSPPIIWTGALTVDAWIQVGDEVVRPDSMRLEFNSVDSGMVANPHVILDLPEGSYSVGVIALYNLVTYTSPRRPVIVVYRQINLYTTELLQANVRGSLEVIAMKDGVREGDSISVWLDRVDLGVGSNPWTINDLAEGRHHLIVTSHAGDLQGRTSEAIVVAEDTNSVEIAFQEIGLENGMTAPDILGQNTDGSVKLLSDEQGKIVYLYFFEYT